METNGQGAAPDRIHSGLLSEEAMRLTISPAGSRAFWARGDIAPR